MGVVRGSNFGFRINIAVVAQGTAEYILGLPSTTNADDVSPSGWVGGNMKGAR